MWGTPFEESMLEYKNGVAINCPTEELEREMMRILDSHGFKYSSGARMNSYGRVWSRHEANFCYYAKGGIVRKGPKGSTEKHTWRNYTKCTFYGTNLSVEISDADFEAIISM